MPDAGRLFDDERHARILDALGEIVVERGIEGVTTALVARRARIAPGKLYELFSDKYDVIRAASDRNLSRYFDAIVDALDGREELTVVEIGRVMFDAWVEMCRRDPAARVLRFGYAPSVATFEGTDSDARVVAAYAKFLALRFGIEDTAQLRQTMTLAVKLVIEPIEYAFALDPQGDPATLAQVARVLEFHLSS